MKANSHGGTEARSGEPALFNITARRVPSSATCFAHVQDQDFQRGSVKGLEAAATKCAWAFCEARHMTFISLVQYGSAALWILFASVPPCLREKKSGGVS